LVFIVFSILITWAAHLSTTRALAYGYSRYCTSRDLRVLPPISIYKSRPSCRSSSNVCNMSTSVRHKTPNTRTCLDITTHTHTHSAADVSYVRITRPYGGGNAIWGFDRPCCSYQPHHRQLASTAVPFLAIQRDVFPYISLDCISIHLLYIVVPLPTVSYTGNVAIWTDDMCCTASYC
jgi:hypothetical protein